VKESSDALRTRLYGLEEGGGTALGPACVVGVAMAATKPGAKLIIATDGLSNVKLLLLFIYYFIFIIFWYLYLTQTHRLALALWMT
jgi:hypothetical protein